MRFSCFNVSNDTHNRTIHTNTEQSKRNSRDDTDPRTKRRIFFPSIPAPGRPRSYSTEETAPSKNEEREKKKEQKNQNRTEDEENTTRVRHDDDRCRCPSSSYNLVLGSASDAPSGVTPIAGLARKYTVCGLSGPPSRVGVRHLRHLCVFGLCRSASEFRNARVVCPIGYNGCLDRRPTATDARGRGE